MKHLYYARHGEGFSNVNDRFGSRPGAPDDLGLTERGRIQAMKDGKRAAAEGMRFDLIVASPLVRARETADIIAGLVGYPLDKIAIYDDLKELQFGVLEGTSWNAWWGLGNTYANLDTVKDAETIEMLQQRAVRALEYLESRPEENILVVGHSAFGRALRRVIQGQPWTDEFENGESLPHGEILELL